MQTLDTINRESFQRFRLRMGINHGAVIAGVIGAQKPQYVAKQYSVNNYNYFLCSEGTIFGPIQ